MAASANRGSGGFRRGFFAGLVVAALGLLALAVARPPAPATPPEIDPSAASGPEAPTEPDLGGAPEPSGAALGPVAPGPLIDGGAAPASPPSLAPIDQPAGAPASPSPSLVPTAPAD